MNDDRHTVRTVLARATARLQAAGVPDAAFDAAWLLAAVLQQERSALLRDSAQPVSAAAQAAFFALVARRQQREPLQYILGTQPFVGLEIAVGPAAMVPRPETELLVEEVLTRLQALPDAELLVADIGTGSGCIAVAVACLEPRAVVYAVDIAPPALALAEQNARRHGVRDRVHLYQGDLLAPLPARLQGRLAAVISNPPYVAAADVPHLMPEVRDYEPHTALTPGDDPLALYKRLARTAPAWLAGGGLLAVEVGAGQARAVAELWRRGGLADIVVRADYGGIERVVIGRWI